MMKAKKVLIVVTSHDRLGESGEVTGYYLPEVSHPVAQLEAQGFEVDIASPKGGKAPMDPGSRNLEDPVNKAFLEREDLVYKIEHTLSPEKISSKDYSAILFAGGHGTMWDFPQSEGLARVSKEIYENGGVVAAVCHGPAALINIRLSSGKYLIDGKQVAGFSNDEEEAAGLTNVMPFLLESALKDRGGIYSKKGLWQEHVVVDQRLVTGQNPASAGKVGEKIAKLIK